MTKKKSILIVAIIAVLVVAICGVSFATWQAFVKPADQTWIVNSEVPDAWTIVMKDSTPVNYNGETGNAGDIYTTTKDFEVTPTKTVVGLGATVVLKVDLNGGTNYQPLPEGKVATVELDGSTMSAFYINRFKATVTFPDLSEQQYIGATFQITLTFTKS